MNSCKISKGKVLLIYTHQVLSQVNGNQITLIICVLGGYITDGCILPSLYSYIKVKLCNCIGKNLMIMILYYFYEKNISRIIIILMGEYIGSTLTVQP